MLPGPPEPPSLPSTNNPLHSEPSPYPIAPTNPLSSLLNPPLPTPLPPTNLPPFPNEPSSPYPWITHLTCLTGISPVMEPSSSEPAHPTWRQYSGWGGLSGWSWLPGWCRVSRGHTPLSSDHTPSSCTSDHTPSSCCTSPSTTSCPSCSSCPCK